jgi:hypothetical protein
MMNTYCNQSDGVVKVSKEQMAQILRKRGVSLYDLRAFVRLANRGRITDGAFRIRLHCCPDYRAAYRDVLALSRDDNVA